MPAGGTRGACHPHVVVVVMTMPAPTQQAASAALPLSSRLAVGVYLHDFQNLDLLAQGWYAIRCRVSHVADGNPAHPHDVLTVPMSPGIATSARPSSASLDWSFNDEGGGGASRGGMVHNSFSPNAGGGGGGSPFSYTSRAFKVLYACEQFPVAGPTLLHFLPQLEHLLWDEEGGFGYKTAQNGYLRLS